MTAAAVAIFPVVPVVLVAAIVAIMTIAPIMAVVAAVVTAIMVVTIANVTVAVRPDRMAVVVLRHSDHAVGNTIVRHERERAAVMPGAVPITVAVDVPPRAIAEHVVTADVGDVVDVGPRHDHHPRLMIEDDRGWGRNVDADVDIDFGGCLPRHGGDGRGNQTGEQRSNSHA